jgi:transposase InsO family protein
VIEAFSRPVVGWSIADNLRAQLAAAIFEYIGAFCNPRRRHSLIGDLSHAELETQLANVAIAA